MVNNKVKIIKLVNDVDIVGEVEKREKDIFIRNPMRCSISIVGEKASIQMVPWCVLSGQDWVIFQSQNVLAVMETREEVIQHYNGLFSGRGFGELTIAR